MTRLALALLACAGCNQLFGLKQTQPLDAPPDAVDAPSDAFAPTLHLERQVLERVGPEMIVTTWSASDPSPTLELGPVGGELTNTFLADDGSFKVPAELLTAPYRIVYTLPGDVPTEIPWSGSEGTFTVPLLGRPDRGTPPSGAGLHFAPTPTQVAFPTASVITTGLWMTALNLGTPPSPFDLAYSSLASLNGPVGAVDGTKGDVEVLTSTDGTYGNGISGFTAMQVTQLQGMPVGSSSTWIQHPTPVSATPAFDALSTTNTRLFGPLGSFPNNGMPVTSYAGGALASATMLSLVQQTPGSLDGGGFLPLWGPSATPVAPMQFANPFDGAHSPAPALPAGVLATYTSSRTYASTKLTSGFEVVGPVGTGAPSLPFAAGMPSAVTLAGTSLSDSGTMDGIGVTIGSAASVALVFRTDKQVDDCVVTLYQVAANVFTPKRRYLVTTLPTLQSPLPIDSSLFMKLTATYTFGIACRVGTRTMNDYTQIKLPFSEAMLYTAVFHVM
ncbi:MAG TPA: hypothetical protein VGF94_16015 [Kofleriaceae bacterium]|jgi:hypothetical protein